MHLYSIYNVMQKRAFLQHKTERTLLTSMLFACFFLYIKQHAHLSFKVIFTAGVWGDSCTAADHLH